MIPGVLRLGETLLRLGEHQPPHPSSQWGDEAQVLVQTLSSDV